MLFQKKLLINEMKQEDESVVEAVPIHYTVKQKLLSSAEKTEGRDSMRTIL